MCNKSIMDIGGVRKNRILIVIIINAILFGMADLDFEWSGEY